MDRQWLLEMKQNQIHPVYFFYGTEDFLIDETLHWIKKQFLSEGGGDGWNLFIPFDLEEVSLQSVIEEVEMPAFLGERRFIIGRNAHFLTTAKEKKSKLNHDIDRLIAYLESPYLGNTLILITPSDQLDKRKKVVKMIEKRVKMVQFQPLNESELCRWVEKQCRQMNVSIQKEATKECIRIVGNHLRLLVQECKKLATYAGPGGEITSKLVHELVPRTLDQDIFQLTEQIANRHIAKAILIWRDLVDQKEEPIQILALMIRQFRLLLKAKILSAEGRSEKEIALILKVHPYPVKLAKKQGAAFSESFLRHILRQAIQADEEIKSGKVDKFLAVERLLFYIGNEEKSPCSVRN